eukprot:365193-Chlamydomonas_euryale.AAC.7
MTFSTAVEVCGTRQISSRYCLACGAMKACAGAARVRLQHGALNRNLTAAIRICSSHPPF